MFGIVLWDRELLVSVKLSWITTVEQKCVAKSKFSPKFTEDGKDLRLSLRAGGLDVLLILASPELGEVACQLVYSQIVYSQIIYS